MNRFLRLIALLGIGLITACQSSLITPLNPFDKGIPFELKMSDNDALKRLLSQELALYRKSLEASQFSQPRKVAWLERQLLIKKLRSEGYYAASVKAIVEKNKLIYRLNPGSRYRIASVTIQQPDGVQVPASVINLKARAPLRAEAVLENKKALHNYLLKHHCMFEATVDYRVILNHALHSAEVIYSVKDSPQVNFGETRFDGLRSIREDYLLARLPFKRGDCFKRSQLDKSRLLLLQTNLIASVSIDEKKTGDGLVDITLQAAERDHRTVTAGAGFDSEEGFGVSAGWEHRNLMGRAEKLKVDAYLAEHASSLSSSLTFPHLWRNNQALTLYTEISSENPDAFESESGTAGVELARQYTSHARAAIGGELTFSKVTEDGETDDYALLSMPMSLQLDYRNDPLDPRTGWVAGLNVRPYWDAYDTATRFLRSTIAASGYLSADSFPGRPTLALRTALGTITGIDGDDVPANVRFYSGGGGSVRGYKYQSLGPATDDEPDGGLSFAEISLETRLRWGENWGAVWFLDGGTAYASATPQLGQDLRWGSGFGLRYYTSFAPIRLDLGFPLQKREQDDAYQIYISIGQAF